MGNKNQGGRKKPEFLNQDHYGGETQAEPAEPAKPERPAREHRDPKAPVTNYYEVTSTVLGQGSFSCVYLGLDRTTQERVAIKVVKKLGNKPDMLKNEIEILLKVHHENIISCLDLFETDDKLYIVMELVTGGELFDRVVLRDQYSEWEAKIVSKQVFSALEYLHSNGIVHRDLKPENILLSNDNDAGPIKITDFGLSKFYSEEMMSTACGSPGYIVLEATGYTAAVDVWSAGVVMYILLCGYPPFYSENEGELFEIILSGSFKFHSPYWDEISPEAKDLISKCLVVDPAKRITAKQALKHPWFTRDTGEPGKAGKPLSKEMKSKLATHASERKSKTNVTELKQ